MINKPTDAILAASGVAKSFRVPGAEPVQVLKHIDLEVRPGERVAILGRSGAGKSTLLHILGGLLRPDVGKVRRPRNFGFVFQAYHLMDELTVFENVLLPVYANRVRVNRRQAAAKARELIAAVGLAERIDHLPAELSGGERQRVAIARALVTGPQLVLADEPTGNLDAMTGADILSMLRDLSAADTALVMVTHSRAAAAVCSRCLRLSGGELVPADEATETAQ